MYTCPKCYKLFREKIDICSRCGFDYSGHATKEQEKNNSRKKDDEKSEIERLKNTIRDLMQREKSALTARDEWKRRADAAENRQNNLPKDTDKKFKKTKRAFSKMYHPDSATGDRFEKLIKQEIFKEFWLVINDIENGDV